MFRECRSLPDGSDDPRRAIFDGFLARVEYDHPGQLARVRTDAFSRDASGRCLLADGQRFRREHGEAVFRAFEIEMLRWASSMGLLVARVPDLSASAPLYEENQALFSPAQGFVPVLLSVPDRLVISRVLADYEIYRASGGSGGGRALRGQYEAALDEVWAGITDTPARASALWAKAEELTIDAKAKRLESYKRYARIEFAPDPAASLRSNALDLFAQIGRFDV